MGELFDSVGSLASFIGSLTIVGGALIWIYNKFIGEPRERKREREETKRQKLMLEVISRENKPLNESITELTKWLDESRADREGLHLLTDKNTSLIEEHERRLDRQNGRLIVLETKNGIFYKGGE